MFLLEDSMGLMKFELDEQRTYKVVKVGRVRMGWYRRRPMTFTVWATKRP